jgi:hypothetical protein
MGRATKLGTRQGAVPAEARAMQPVRVPVEAFEYRRLESPTTPAHPPQLLRRRRQPKAHRIADVASTRSASSSAACPSPHRTIVAYAHKRNPLARRTAKSAKCRCPGCRVSGVCGLAQPGAGAASSLAAMVVLVSAADHLRPRAPSLGDHGSARSESLSPAAEEGVGVQRHRGLVIMQGAAASAAAPCTPMLDDVVQRGRTAKA